MGEGTTQPFSPPLPVSLAGYTVYYSKGGIWPAGQEMGGHCKEAGLALAGCADPVGWNLMACYFVVFHLSFAGPLLQGVRVG